MAREAGDLTKAIRKLCQQTDLKITHSEARPHLKRLGFNIATEPPDKSDTYKKWEANKKGKYPKEPEMLIAYYKTTVCVADLPLELFDSIMKEDALHRVFNNEQNNFDVTKWNYHRLIGLKSGRKIKNINYISKKIVTKVDKTFNKEAVSSLNWLLDNGGSAAVEKKVRALKAELNNLMKMLNRAASIHKILPSAA